MLLITNADLYTPSPAGRVDILVAGGRIERVAPGLGALAPFCEVFDASGLVAAPGFIDSHVHIGGGGGEGGWRCWACWRWPGPPPSGSAH